MVQVKIKWACVIAGCITFSCISFSQDSTTQVVLSSTTVHGVAGRYYGADFALRNIETYDLYQSMPLNCLISKYSFVDNLPVGRYEVLYLGSHKYQRIDSVVQEFFGVLDLTKSEGYYLGSFKGRVPVGRNMPIYFEVSVGSTPRRLTRVLQKREILAEDQELIACPPYARDSLVLRQIR